MGTKVAARGDRRSKSAKSSKGKFGAETQDIRAAFFKHKSEKRAQDPKKLSPLQKRMNSGRA